MNVNNKIEQYKELCVSARKSIEINLANMHRLCQSSSNNLANLEKLSTDKIILMNSMLDLILASLTQIKNLCFYLIKKAEINLLLALHEYLNAFFQEISETLSLNYSFIGCRYLFTNSTTSSTTVLSIVEKFIAGSNSEIEKSKFIKKAEELNALLYEAMDLIQTMAMKTTEITCLTEKNENVLEERDQTTDEPGFSSVTLSFLGEPVLTNKNENPESVHEAKRRPSTYMNMPGLFSFRAYHKKSPFGINFGKEPDYLSAFQNQI